MFNLVLIIVLFGATFILGAYNAIVERQNRVRELKEYANLPKKVLLTDILNSRLYSEQYHDLRRVVSDDRAATITIKRMLNDMKVLKYRKEEL